MKQHAFKIFFDMPIRGSGITIPMRALAELHHSDPYYVVRSMEIVPKQPGANAGYVFSKEIKIKQVKEGTENIWVHCDTGRESDLSRSVGLAIERSGVGT